MKKIMNDIIVRNILKFMCYYPYWTVCIIIPIISIFLSIRYYNNEVILLISIILGVVLPFILCAIIDINDYDYLIKNKFDEYEKNI